MDKNEDYNFESLSGTANFDEVIQTKLTEWLMFYLQHTTARSRKQLILLAPRRGETPLAAKREPRLMPYNLHHVHS